MSLPERLPSRGQRAFERRTVLRTAAGAGTAVAAASLLAACGGEPGGAAGGTGGTGVTDENSASGGIDTSVPASEVPVGAGVVLVADDVVVTQPVEGEFHAFSAICTHEGCAVARVDARGINCPCHGSLFSVTDGAPLAGPAPAPLAPLVATIEGDTVHVTSP